MKQPTYSAVTAALLVGIGFGYLAGVRNAMARAAVQHERDRATWSRSFDDFKEMTQSSINSKSALIRNLEASKPKDGRLPAVMMDGVLEVRR